MGPDSTAAQRLLSQVVRQSGISTATLVSERTLRNALGMSGDRFSAAVESLQRRGWVATAEPEGDGFRLTESGQAAFVRSLPEHGNERADENWIELAGFAKRGLGEGATFVRLEGYREQFVDKLGYDPFPGTFNVELNEESIEKRPSVEEFDTIQIDGWAAEDRTFGPATCVPSSVIGPTGRSARTSHLVVPARTDHDLDQIELLAPVNLRERLSVADGDPVTVIVQNTVDESR